MPSPSGCLSGQPLDPSALSTSQRERFWATVAIGDPDECWPWRLRPWASGYGYFRIGGDKKLRAHRIAHVLASGKALAAGVLVLHSCDVRHCCNPRHLREGTPKDNGGDMMQRGRWRGYDRERHQRGERIGTAKMTNVAVVEIRALVQGHALTATAIGKRYGITLPTVYNIATGRTWAHVPGALSDEEWRTAMPIGRPPSIRKRLAIEGAGGA